jgi:hypothetical protein
MVRLLKVLRADLLEAYMEWVMMGSPWNRNVGWWEFIGSYIFSECVVTCVGSYCIVGLGSNVLSSTLFVS